jgi:hypothetical protein
MAKDEVPVEDAEIVEAPPEKPPPGVSQSQLNQTAVVVRPHSAPVQIPKSYDELFMRQINRWWDYYIKFGWMHEWSPWERRRFIKIGEGLLWYVSSMDVDRSIGDAIWTEYTEYRQTLQVEDTELVEKLARLIFYELTARGKTGTQATTARNRVSESKLASRFNAMFGDAGIESYHEIGLGDVVAMMQQDVADDYDVLVLICAKEGDVHGGKGMGKSDVAQVLAAMLDPRFDTRFHTVYGEDVARMRKMMNTKKHGIAWVVDELDRFVNKQRTMTKAVTEISSDFIARRYLNQYVIGCVPQVWYCATKFLDNVTYLIRVLQRGIVEVYRGNERDEPAKEWKGQQVGGPGQRSRGCRRTVGSCTIVPRPTRTSTRPGPSTRC